MLQTAWAFLTSSTITVPLVLCTTTLSIISVYDNAILVRSKGDEQKAQRLYAKTGKFVLVPISFLAILYAAIHFAVNRDFNAFFVIAVPILFLALCMAVYVLAYVQRPKFKMVPRGDWIAEKLLGRFIGDDMAVIVGRSLVTIIPLATVILTVMDHYGPAAPL